MSTGHGGKRTGAGRPKGSGKYKERTQVMRIPMGLVDQVVSYLESKGYQLPMYSNKVSAGFPLPADDHIEAQLDLNTHLIKNPSSTFLVRVAGESMRDAGIFPNDILVVDRSIKPKEGKVVVVALDGELTVKRLQKQAGQLFLMPENPEYKPIAVGELQELNVWGVVTNVIHAL